MNMKVDIISSGLGFKLKFDSTTTRITEREIYYFTNQTDCSCEFICAEKNNVLNSTKAFTFFLLCKVGHILHGFYNAFIF